jgi:hypothetical protein
MTILSPPGPTKLIGKHTLCLLIFHADTGFPGTMDMQNFPSSEALAVGHHPTDDGTQPLLLDTHRKYTVALFALPHA